jgi:transposase
MDEARFGLKVMHRRRWCPKGARPPWEHEDRYEWLWLYAAVEPSTGESFVLFLPHTDGACLATFLQAFRRAVPDGRLGLLLDGSGSHTSDRVAWPADLVAVRPPPYSPELNPAERWFEELRAALANRVFDSLEQLETALTEALRPYWAEPGKLSRLTNYPWWKEALQTNPTSAK